MIKREEVEALLRELREANQWRQHRGVWGPSAAFARDHATRIEELARTWLAVDGAQSAEITREDWLENFTQIGADMIGQRVKLVLVPEADSGGDRG